MTKEKKLGASIFPFDLSNNVVDLNQLYHPDLRLRISVVPCPLVFLFDFFSDICIYYCETDIRFCLHLHKKYMLRN